MVFIVFLILKLAEIGVVATWSWWWVTAPLWIPFCLVMVFLMGIGCVALIVIACKAYANSKATKQQVARARKLREDQAKLREDQAAKKRADEKG